MQRRRAAVLATLVFAILGVAGRLVSARGDAYLVDLACLALAYWVPASVMTSAREVLRRWPMALGCILGATLLWDAALSFGTGARRFFAEWYIVYPSSVLVFGMLLLASGAVVSGLGRHVRRAGGRPSRGSPRTDERPRPEP